MTRLRHHKDTKRPDRKTNLKAFINPIASEHFGEHVMIDGYGCSVAKLDDRQRVLDCLIELPAKLLMTPLSRPEVYFAQGASDKDPGGWTGFVVIQESHISIHTFPQIRFVSIDVYTCKNGLNAPEICKYFKDRFDMETYETQFVKRGLAFNRLGLRHAEST